ncbi:hypothetical protein KJ855_04445 [Patescibacteria group bacterium]|nr:hypothetical protein [Patescibacteria group bacterium]
MNSNRIEQAFGMDNIDSRIEITDRIYGKVEIIDPLLVELFNLPSLQRLKGVSQFGVPKKYNHSEKDFFRDEHCRGVMILLKKLGASREEQIAGLLHDVSVPAFSHIGDWLFGGGKKGIENFHDSIHDDFVKNQTNIPQTLERFGIKVDDILDEKKYTLLDNKIPDLCADRVDYALREFDLEKAKLCYKSLINYNGEIVFDSKLVAREFAYGFLSLQKNHWASEDCCLRYFLFTKALKIGIDKKIITQDDFFRSDGEIFIVNKLENSNDKEIDLILEKLLGEDLLDGWKEEKEEIRKKFRYVNPKYLENRKILVLKDNDFDFAKDVEEAKEENLKGYRV